MKKIALFIYIITLISPLALMTSTVNAVDILNPVCQNADPNNLPRVCKENQSTATDNPIVGPKGVVTRGVYFLSLVGGVLAVIVIIISGLRFIMSQGDSNSISSAKRGIIYAVIGLLIAATAQIIVAFVLSKLPG